MSKSAYLFRLCWSASLGGLVAAIPTLILLYRGEVRPRYSWTIHFWEFATVALAILCVVALRADLKARRKSSMITDNKDKPTGCTPVVEKLRCRECCEIVVHATSCWLNAPLFPTRRSPVLDSERVPAVEAEAPPLLPVKWVKVDNDHLPNEDDICIVWGRNKEFVDGLSISETPWEPPDLSLTRGWWVIQNSDTLIGAAERQAKATYFSQEPWTTGLTAQALYYAVLKEATRLHGWEPGSKPFRKSNQYEQRIS